MSGLQAQKDQSKRRLRMKFQPQVIKGKTAGGIALVQGFLLLHALFAKKIIFPFPERIFCFLPMLQFQTNL